MTPKEPCIASNGGDMAFSLSARSRAEQSRRAATLLLCPRRWTVALAKTRILIRVTRCVTSVIYSNSFLLAALYCVMMSNFAAFERPGFLSISFN